MEEEEEEVGRNKGKQKEIFLDSSSSVTFSSVKHPISAEKLRNCHAAVSHSTAPNLWIFLAPISLKKISRMKSHSRDLFWTESFKPVYFTRLITSLQNARNVLDCWVGATIERKRERKTLELGSLVTIALTSFWISLRCIEGGDCRLRFTCRFTFRCIPLKRNTIEDNDLWKSLRRRNTSVSNLLSKSWLEGGKKKHEKHRDKFRNVKEKFKSILSLSLSERNVQPRGKRGQMEIV